MGFINDRFTVSANWILNPDVFWKGNNLVEYVNSSSGDTTEWTIPDFSTHPKYGELIHKLSNNSPQNLWQLLSTYDGSINFVLPGLDSLNSPKTKKWLLRNIYSTAFLNSWNYSDFTIQPRRLWGYLEIDNMAKVPLISQYSNIPTKDNHCLAKFIRRLNSWTPRIRNFTVSRPFAWTTERKLYQYSTDILLITSLPDFLISRKIIEEFITVDNEVHEQSEIQDMDMDIPPEYQSLTYNMLPKIMINPRWLHATGWYDLWNGEIETVHSCTFCFDETIYCSDCEEGLTECSECNTHYNWQCDMCQEGWQECNVCEGAEDIDCEACDDGTLVCELCEGSGTETCEGCQGEGEITDCPDCTGTGWNDEKPVDSLDDKFICQNCEGEGSVPSYSCNDCDSSGEIACSAGCETGELECFECDDGRIACAACAAEGGSYCEEGCDEGEFWCEYCEEGFNPCAVCEGQYEWGPCPQGIYEDTWGETIDTSIGRLFSKKSRKETLEDLMSLVRPLPIEAGELNILHEVYGELEFKFLTMSQIWDRFLKVMNSSTSESLYFFNPTPIGINILYTTEAHTTDSCCLGLLTNLSRPSISIRTELFANHQPVTNVRNFRNTNLRVTNTKINPLDGAAGAGLTPSSVHQLQTETNKIFKEAFNISISPQDEVYWGLFWNVYKNNLMPLIDVEEELAGRQGDNYRTSSKPNKSLENFRFLLGSSKLNKVIIALNYPKG
tara:strand:+ start:2494 stop:4668 length:2175 start_codon:yes stop_codon:yes gene_type:complete